MKHLIDQFVLLLGGIIAHLNIRLRDGGLLLRNLLGVVGHCDRWARLKLGRKECGV